MKQGNLMKFFGGGSKKKDADSASSQSQVTSKSENVISSKNQKNDKIEEENEVQNSKIPENIKVEQVQVNVLSEVQVKTSRGSKRKKIIDSDDDDQVIQKVEIASKQFKKVDHEVEEIKYSSQTLAVQTNKLTDSKQTSKSMPNEEKSNGSCNTKVQEQITNSKEKSIEGLRNIMDKQFDPVKDAPFYHGQDVLFGYLCEGFERVNEQEGKNSKSFMIEIMSKIFKSIILLNPSQVYPAYMFCILKIAPDYESNELGVGREILQKAISSCCGKSVSQVRDSLNKLGDLGKVAAQAKSTQKNISTFFSKEAQKKPPITLTRTFNDLKNIASAQGQASTSKREGIIVKYMNEAKPDEICYFIRFIEQNLKIGAAEKTMQAALSKAFFEIAHNFKSNHIYTEKDTELLEEFNFNITRCLCEFPNYFNVIEALKIIGKDIQKLLEMCKITIGIPCKPMLAKPTKSIQV